MSNPELQKQARLFRILTVVGLVLTTLSFFAPMWWVSLKAPNYPEATFPQGVKIMMPARLYHYGFALALPGTVALLAARPIGWESFIECDTRRQHKRREYTRYFVTFRVRVFTNNELHQLFSCKEIF